MDANGWKWTLSFLVLYPLLGFLLNTLAQFVYEKLGFWPPDAGCRISVAKATLNR